MDRLEELRSMLLRGIRLSAQRSLDRRAPAETAIPILSEARDGLAEFVREHSESAGAWRALSQAEECLLRFGPSIAALERAMELSGARTKKDIKRLAALRASQEDWQQLPISPRELAELGSFLREKLRLHPPARDFRWTVEWLLLHELDVEEIIPALEARGAHSDMMVLANIAFD